MPSIMWFKELHKSDTEIAGGKGANLGELENAGFPVPPGFVITAEAYLAAMEAAGVRVSRWSDASSAVDVDDQAAGRRDVRAAARHGPAVPIPRRRWPPRSSTPTTASVPRRWSRCARRPRPRTGRRLLRRHEPDVHQRPRRRAAARTGAGLLGVDVRRAGHRLPRPPKESLDEPAIAVSSSTCSHPEPPGSCSPPTRPPGDRDRIVIEAAFGQGEVVVGGQVEPDTYVVAKSRPDGPRGPRRPEVPQDRARRRRRRARSSSDRRARVSAGCSPTTQILELARLALRVEAALRRAAGHGVRHRGRAASGWCRAGRSPRWATAPRPTRRADDRRWCRASAPPRASPPGRVRVLDSPERRCPAPGRRGPGGAA